MNYSSQNEYYRRDSKIIRQSLNQKKLETQISFTKSPLKENRKINYEYDGATNNSYQIKQNNFVSRVRVAPQPMFKSTVQKHGVIKHVLRSPDRIHSESQNNHQNLIKKRSERNIFYNKLISISTKRSYKKIKQEQFITNEKSCFISKADITYLQSSEIDVKPLVGDTSLQINNQNENKLIGKNKYQIISYAKKQEKYNIMNQTDNQIIDDNASETNDVIFKSKRKF